MTLAHCTPAPLQQASNDKRTAGASATALADECDHHWDHMIGITFTKGCSLTGSNGIRVYHTAWGLRAGHQVYSPAAGG
jgi:hypothetical protein